MLEGAFSFKPFRMAFFFRTTFVVMKNIIAPLLVDLSFLRAIGGMFQANRISDLIEQLFGLWNWQINSI